MIILTPTQDAFIKAYMGCALWSSNDESDPETGGEPMDSNYSVEDISAATFKEMTADCLRFYNEMISHIHCDGAPCASDTDGPVSIREAAQAGHDFWLTRCGHGAGFWDGDWPEPHASVLDAESKKFGQCDLYISDNGEICS